MTETTTQQPARNREEATLVEIQYRSQVSPWGIATFCRDDGTTFAACGEFGHTVLYEEFIMYGERVPDFEGGDFEVSQFTSRPPRNTKSLSAYLSALTGAMRGNMTKLVEHFGESTIEVIERSPERLAESGVAAGDLQRLVSGWKSLRSDRLAMSKIEVEGIPIYKLSKLARYYGMDCDLNQLIKSDPYSLYIHFDDLHFSSAVRLANRIGIPNQTESAVRGAIVAALRREAWLGHSVIQGRALGEAVVQLLRVPVDVVKAHLGPAVSALRRLEVIHVENNRVQLRSLHDAEQKLFAQVEQWASRDETELEHDLVPSEEIGLKLLKPMKLKIGETKQLLAGVSGLLSECFAIVQCQTFEDQLFVARALALIFNAYDSNAVVATYTLEMLNETSASLNGLLPVMGYAELLGMDRETSIPLQREANPIEADALVVLGADALGVEEMNQLILAAPKNARLYLLGCPKDLPSLSVGQPFADLIESNQFKAFHASFWGLPECAKRIAQESIWAETLTPDLAAFSPTQPVSWFKCEQEYLPSLASELLAQLGNLLGRNPLISIRFVAPSTSHDMVRKVKEALIEEFAEDNLAITFQGRKHYKGLPFVVRQPMTTESPAFAVFTPTQITETEMKVVGINGDESIVRADERIDIFDAMVMSPKFIRGQRYEFVVLLAIPDQIDLINQELISGLLNASSKSLIVVGEIDGVMDAIGQRPSQRTRTELINWTPEK